MIGMSQFQTFPYIPSSASGNLVMPAALFYCHFFGPPGILLGKEIRKAHKSCFLHVTTVAPWETITYQFPWYTLKVTQHGHLFFVERAACHPVSHSLDFLGLCHLQVLSLSSSLSTQRGNYLLSLSVCVCASDWRAHSTSTALFNNVHLNPKFKLWIRPNVEAKV